MPSTTAQAETSESDPLLPQPSTTTTTTTPKSRRNRIIIIHYLLPIFALLSLTTLLTLALLTILHTDHDNQKSKGEDVYALGKFWNKTMIDPSDECGWGGKSESGYIGLRVNGSDERLKKGEKGEKNMFYWFFEAENDKLKNAPIILTMGGGPGVSGLIQAVSGIGPCRIQDNGSFYLNPDRYTSGYNVIVLDHPVGTGYSYGSILTETSEEAAYDVYDFMQKFFKLHPELASRPLHLVGGSYGGIYQPWIATIMNEQNKLVRKGEGKGGAREINLQSVMISNPIENELTHFRWMSYWFCVETSVWDTTQCHKAARITPLCEQAIQIAFDLPSLENRLKAQAVCDQLEMFDMNGWTREDTTKRCEGDILQCQPVFAALSNFYNGTAQKTKFGVDPGLNYNFISEATNNAFTKKGDRTQDVGPFFPILLTDGIRVLHYQGINDGNCNKYGVEAGLRTWRTPFAASWANLTDTPWPLKNSTSAAVRSYGPGAGVMAYVQIADAGHFVIRDQTALVKRMTDTWVHNKPWH